MFIFYRGGDVILHNSILFGPYNVVELTIGCVLITEVSL